VEALRLGNLEKTADTADLSGAIASFDPVTALTSPYIGGLRSALLLSSDQVTNLTKLVEAAQRASAKAASWNPPTSADRTSHSPDGAALVESDDSWPGMELCLRLSVNDDARTREAEERKQQRATELGLVEVRGYERNWGPCGADSLVVTDALLVRELPAVAEWHSSLSALSREDRIKTVDFLEQKADTYIPSAPPAAGEPAAVGGVTYGSLSRCRLRCEDGEVDYTGRLAMDLTFDEPWTVFLARMLSPSQWVDTPYLAAAAVLRGAPVHTISSDINPDPHHWHITYFPAPSATYEQKDHRYLLNTADVHYTPAYVVDVLVVDGQPPNPHSPQADADQPPDRSRPPGGASQSQEEASQSPASDGQPPGAAGYPPGAS
jgi:hypothetical protein